MIFLMGKSESKPLMESRFFIEGFTPHISQNITPHHLCGTVQQGYLHNAEVHRTQKAVFAR